MTIYPLSGASWPAKQQSCALAEDARGSGRRRDMQTYPSSSSSSCIRGGSPRQWELRKIASFPAIDADYWSDASLSLPHLAAALPPAQEQERVSLTSSCSRSTEEAPIESACNNGRMQVDEPMKARGGGRRFPPPLDSPALMWEERYPHLESLERVCFTCVRSNGRLLVMEAPPTAAQPRRRLLSERSNGRLLLRLYVESRPTEERPLEAGGEEKDPFANQESPSAEEATTMAASAQSNAEEEDGEGSLCTTPSECDALKNDSAELAFTPKYIGRSSGVASFLHKSLTRVRPLSIWQS